MSSRKNILKPFQIITNGDMSTASITSRVTSIQYLDNICIELFWTGSPVGTFAVQGSLDYAQDEFGNVTNTGHWVPMALNPSPSTAAGSPILIDMNQLSFPYIRVIYTKTSGTGTLQGYVGGKQL